MKSKEIDISIVIVNYNVKEFISNLVDSIKKSIGSIKYEIIIVDNNSYDGSVPFLKKNFPDTKLIVNNDNVGFAVANNQAFKEAKGKYTFILNPDTLVQENTLLNLFHFLENHPNYGSVGCKILNPDGTFAPESRRQEPNPISALGQTLGLTKIIPNNKKWAGYYMNWLSEDEFTDVEVLSGSCMFFRTHILKELDGFDEQFFMYGEDIDLCKRTRDLGYKIAYLPTTSIVHYKGESTKKDRLDYVVIFNKAMLQYFNKHYSKTTSLFFRVVIVFGIFFRGAITYIKLKLKKFWPLIIDLIAINGLIFPLFILRYNISINEILDYYQPEYFVVNIFLSISFILASLQTGLYESPKNSFSSVFKSVFFTFTLTIVVSFFFKEYAFSRLILLAGGLITFLLLSIIRFFYSRKDLLPKRTLLVGFDSQSSDVISKLIKGINWDYNVIGIITNEHSISSTELNSIPILGSIQNLPTIAKKLKIEQVIFDSTNISYNEILSQLTKLSDLNIHSKLIANSQDYLIGKSKVEYVQDMPILDIDLSFNNPFNKVLKRTSDIVISLLLLIVLSPLVPLLIITLFFKEERKSINLDHGYKISLFSNAKKIWLNFYIKLYHVLIGNLSLVGLPIEASKGDKINISYKKGITGISQINSNLTSNDEIELSQHLNYLKFYSVWLDFEIMLKAIFNK